MVRVDGHHGRLDGADDTTGTDPFTTPVDVPGVLTHGHLAENDNHGGAPDPDNYVDMTKLPVEDRPSGTVLPIADFAYQGDMSGIYNDESST